MRYHARKVHVHDREGRVIYNMLWDDGGETILFEVYGFLTREQVRREGWTLCDGWCERDADGFVCAQRRAA